MPTHPKLGDPRNFWYGKNKWYEQMIQSYAQWRAALGTGSGVEVHHLVPQSLLKKGPPFALLLLDYVPSVPLDRSQHMDTVHATLTPYLRQHEVMGRPLTSAELARAIQLTSKFYKERKLEHFGAVIDEFYERAYQIAAVSM